MPYFYKPSDFLDTDNDDTADDWLDIVEFTIADFVIGCGQKYAGQADREVVTILLVGSDNIIPHPDHLRFEYRTNDPNDTVPPISISDIDTVNFTPDDIYLDDNGYPYFYNEARNRLEDFIISIPELLDFEPLDEIYIHITCRLSRDSILANGILGNNLIPDNQRIGDRQGINDGMHLSKYLKYKTKYLELKNKLRASAHELLKK